MDEETLSSIFEQMGRRPPQPQIYELAVEFKDSVLGADREITFPNGNKVVVKIPPGVATGTKLRFAGKGENRADIYVQLNVKVSADFKRVGKNLEMELPVSFVDAVLAKEVKVPTIDGFVSMKIPNNVTSDQKVKVKGKGVVDPATGARGDQIVILKIKMPDNIDDDFRNAVEKWGERQIKKSVS
jgi:DnaJ-class molecular chaperone